MAQRSVVNPYIRLILSILYLHPSIHQVVSCVCVCIFQLVLNRQLISCYSAVGPSNSCITFDSAEILDLTGLDDHDSSNSDSDLL